MRNIEFRGQQINTKKWIYGYLYRNKGLYCICENIRYAEEEPIFIDTIGQYTGLKDKNGTKIFEGDIVYDEYSDRNGVIKYSEENAQFQIIIENEVYNFSDNYGKDYKVIRKYI